MFWTSGAAGSASGRSPSVGSSSVATALVDGESRPKHVAILQLHKQQWKLDAIPLRTVRPFLMRDVTLADHDGGEYDLQVEADLT